MSIVASGVGADLAYNEALADVPISVVLFLAGISGMAGTDRSIISLNNATDGNWALRAKANTSEIAFYSSGIGEKLTGVNLFQDPFDADAMFTSVGFTWDENYRLTVYREGLPIYNFAGSAPTNGASIRLEVGQATVPSVGALACAYASLKMWNVVLNANRMLEESRYTQPYNDAGLWDYWPLEFIENLWSRNQRLFGNTGFVNSGSGHKWDVAGPYIAGTSPSLLSGALLNAALLSPSTGTVGVAF